MASLVTSAYCLRPGCGWSAEGEWAAVDKAAAAHTEKPPKHPTACGTRAT